MLVVVAGQPAPQRLGGSLALAAGPLSWMAGTVLACGGSRLEALGDGGSCGNWSCIAAAVLWPVRALSCPLGAAGRQVKCV